jgi:proline racemase
MSPYFVPWDGDLQSMVRSVLCCCWRRGPGTRGNDFLPLEMKHSRSPCGTDSPSKIIQLPGEQAKKIGTVSNGDQIVGTESSGGLCCLEESSRLVGATDRWNGPEGDAARRGYGFSQ